MKLSIVIPALNEEANLPRLFASVNQQLLRSGLTYELLVADNGSTDRTALIATENGATVVDAKGSTIGAARNRAAREAQGDILVFLDADMILLDGWADTMSQIVPQMETGNRQITGGSVAAPPTASWVAQAWFREPTAAHTNVRYVGSAHMVISRPFFMELGGFDPELRSAEDYDICVRAKEAGARVRKEPGLSAYHLGAPESLSAFFRRELWHGSSGRIPQIFRQRTTWIAGLWLTLHLTLSLFTAAWWHTDCLACGPTALANAILLVLLPSLLAVRRGGARPITRAIPRIILYYISLWARALALAKALVTRRRPPPAVSL